MLADPAGSSARRLIGLAGPPGCGKSTLAARIAEAYALPVVPMDGFHLADVELGRRGLRERKGAPETFDAWGYAALLARLADRPAHVVMAPSFDRDLDQPLAGAVPVTPEARCVLTEGNYLLLEDGGWAAAHRHLDEVWFLDVPPAVRRERLVARHVRHGRTTAQARAWVERVDEPNARRVEASRERAEVILDLADWDHPGRR
ncbi:nucleoside/nucleotide kinase family protein [Nocardioidaceae bacterium]|nr:nucleoside/nucleotide kinase family protein [Nocardioidaceae bacterium]